MTLIEHIEENQFEGSLNGCTYYSMIKRNSQNPWNSSSPDHSVHDILHPDSKWIKVANLPEGRSHGVAVTINETVVGNREVLVIGGRTDSGRALESCAILYQESTDSWTPFPYQLNRDRRFCCQIAKVGSKIFVFGGISEEDDHFPTYEVLDWNDPPEQRCWSLHTMPSMVSSNGKRAGYSIAAIDDRIYLLGGFVNGERQDSNATSDVFILNTQTNTWSNGPQMLSRRAIAAATRLGSHLVVLGGGTSIRGRIAQVERLDVQAREPVWLPCEPMMKPRVFPRALSIGDDKLLIIGYGTGREGGDFDMEVWNGTKGEKKNEVPSRFTLRYASCQEFEPPFTSVMVGSDLMLIGGCFGSTARSRNVECLLSPHRVLEHQLKQIKSETLLNEAPLALWPYMFHRLGKKQLISIIFHFVREKNSMLAPPEGKLG